jgi:FAD/FMN-containing dehydrogenase/Fe-S oxidoreductase
MPDKNLDKKLSSLKNSISGELYFDEIFKTIYSTDASAYKEKPLAVAYPKNKEDLLLLIRFAKENHTSLIPRGAGTSLAGQVTGSGIVVDVSKFMNSILSFDNEKKTITVQPGLILSELNQYLIKFGLFFGPETSTSNRCTIGGMVGNNACGLHSLVYGCTRDHTLSIKALLSDGSEVFFEDLNHLQFIEKLNLNTFEGELYRNINTCLSDHLILEDIEKQFPDKEVPRRNTGYALDILADNSIFGTSDKHFNFCKLLCGSEGTLAFFTEITLHLLELPPPVKALSVVHFNSLNEALYANLIALKYMPDAIELMDKTILDLSAKSKGLEKTRFFLQGEPEAILMIEFSGHTQIEIKEIVQNMETEMRNAGYGFHFTLIWNNDISKVWDLRKAGLGVLSNMPGDAQPVSLVEDTAVNVTKLPEYIADFQELLKKYELSCVYHAHIGTGELHMRPILNLKDPKEVELFKVFALETAKLVKKYRGSLSGEHGDGRLRGEFIPLMYGDTIYQIFKDLKKCWDPLNIFNPGKITDTPAMNAFLRYSPGQGTKEFETIFDFSESLGYIRATEKCNGSGDCLKPVTAGGTMCPSYKASKNEAQSTRARANMLREIMTNTEKPFEDKDIYSILDLCLSCKACKSECPSNVDISKLKAEFLQHYYDKKGTPVRSRLVANITQINKILSFAPGLANVFFKSKAFSLPVMKLIGFSIKRQMPVLSKKTLKKQYPGLNLLNTGKKVYLLADEFTNYNDAEIGIKAIKLLDKLGYHVILPDLNESGRTWLSKGLVRHAKKIAEENLNLLKNIISENTPLIGIEPSAILTFRDEYPEFFKPGEHMKEMAKQISKNTLMIDEFIVNEIMIGNIVKEQFTNEEKFIKLHGHCQQKAIVTTDTTKFMLAFPEHYIVEEIPSGCCGMAGSFGYEKEHYELSMNIGETVLFPAVRSCNSDTLIAAPGTSCRHQIKDGTGRTAVHPIEIMWDALIKH